MTRKTLILMLLLVGIATAIPFHLVLEGPPGTVAVHRFWHLKMGTHFYTSKLAEVSNLKNNYPHVYAYEGIVGYWWPNPTDPIEPNIVEVNQ